MELILLIIVFGAFSMACGMLLCTCWDALAQRWQDWQDNRQFDKLKGKR